MPTHRVGGDRIGQRLREPGHLASGARPCGGDVLVVISFPQHRKSDGRFLAPPRHGFQETMLLVRFRQTQGRHPFRFQHFLV